MLSILASDLEFEGVTEHHVIKLLESYTGCLFKEKQMLFEQWWAVSQEEELHPFCLSAKKMTKGMIFIESKSLLIMILIMTLA